MNDAASSDAWAGKGWLCQSCLGRNPRDKEWCAQCTKRRSPSDRAIDLRTNDAPCGVMLAAVTTRKVRCEREANHVGHHESGGYAWPQIEPCTQEATCKPELLDRAGTLDGLRIIDGEDRAGTFYRIGGPLRSTCEEAKEDLRKLIAAWDAPRVDKAPSTLSERTLRDLLRLLVGHLEVDAKAGDGIHEDAYDDYHAARMIVGQAGEGWDPDAAGRAMRRITGDEWWTAPKEIQ